MGQKLPEKLSKLSQKTLKLPDIRYFLVVCRATSEPECVADLQEIGKQIDVNYKVRTLHSIGWRSFRGHLETVFLSVQITSTHQLIKTYLKTLGVRGVFK